MSQNFRKPKNPEEKARFIDLCSTIACRMIPILYSPHQKYDYEYIFTCLLDFVETRVSWTKYRGTIDCPIDGKYLNQYHNKFVKHGVYDEINKCMVQKYLKHGKEEKLKNQTIDSSFIQNKQGSVKNNNHLLNESTIEKNEKIKK